MPGIVGIVGSSSEAKLDDLMSSMCNIIRHENWYSEDRYVDKGIALGRVGLGIFNPEKQPIFSKDKSLCILMEGEIYDYESYKSDLIEKGYSFSINNDPEFVLYLYKEYGENFVDMLNGSFTVAIWDVEKRELIIANDRYSSRPLYYAVNNNKLLFAPEIKAILEDETLDKEINEVAMAEFLIFGYPLEERTLFRRVSFLPPGSILNYSKGRISVKKYWDFPYTEDYKDYSESHYIEGLANLLLRAVERQLQGSHRMGVSLSGGLDSRTIVACIDRKYYPIHTITFAERGCDDQKFAKLVANKLGTIHHFYQLSPESIVDFFQKASWISDGVQSPWTMHGISILEDERSYCNVMLSGIPGDLTIGGSYLTDNILSASNEDEFVQAVYRKMSGIFANGEIMSLLFRDDSYRKINGTAFESLRQILRGCKDTIYANRGDHFFFRDRAAHNSALGLYIARTQFEYRTPFLDNDLVDFVLTVPPELRWDHYIYIKTFSKLFPYLSKIPWQKTGLPINAGRLRRNFFHTKALVKRKFYSGLRKKFGISLSSRDTHPMVNYREWLKNDKKLQQFFYGILTDRGAGLSRYFEPHVVKSMLQEHFAGERNNKDIIGRIMTFEFWNRLFIDRKIS